jgi:hypothetical protein
VGALGEPIRGVAVQVKGVAGGDLLRPYAFRIFSGPVTDARGKARISPVALGSVRVVARSANLAPGIGAPVRLTAERPWAEVQIVLTHGGSIEGELMDVYGEPAFGTSLSVTHRAWPGQVSQSIMGFRENTGFRERTEVRADGSFRFGNLPPGAYSLYTRAEDEDRKRVPNRHVELQVHEGQTTRVVFDDLRGSYVALSGLVLRDGEPVAGARVNISRADNSRGFLNRDAKTDAEGLFEVTLDEGGDYQIQISDRELGASVFQELTVPPNSAHEVLIAYRTGQISGRVLDPDGTLRTERTP